MSDFLVDAHKFTGGDGFVDLLSRGLAITGLDYHRELAKELGVIPASIMRWAHGESLPLPGMQVVVIRILRKKIEHL